MALPKVIQMTISMGCDPEFFLKKDGKIIGAEKFLPETGISYITRQGAVDGRHTVTGNMKESKFIIDGVQAELNPRPNTCRANLANEIASCFKLLKQKMEEKKQGIAPDFSQTVEIDPVELASLDKKNQKFGCAPAQNNYKENKQGKITVNPYEYKYRSAGGHLHLGDNNNMQLKKVLQTPDKIIPLLDIILGNTAVMIDRDPGNVERRKHYGRAGEFRLPAHGLEYRTLSNFWLYSYPLMSLVTGLARECVEMAYSDTGVYHNIYDNRFSIDKYLKAFTDAVKMNEIEEAINNNDFDLARHNWLKIKPLLIECTQAYNEHYPIVENNMSEFEFFVEKGTKHFWNHDPFEHWTTLPEAHRGGFNHYLCTVVRNGLAAQPPKRTKTIAVA